MTLNEAVAGDTVTETGGFRVIVAVAVFVESAWLVAAASERPFAVVRAVVDTPDRELNTKFDQKLNFIERMTRWSESLSEPTLIVGVGNDARVAQEEIFGPVLVVIPFDGDVTVQLSKISGVSMPESVVIPHGQAAVEVELKAAADAAPNKGAVQLSATESIQRQASSTSPMTGTESSRANTA